MQQSKWAQPGGSPNTGQSFNRQSLFGGPQNNSAPSILNHESDMTVCKFYPRGTCRNGDQCNFEHPGSQRDANRNSGSAFGAGSSNNRFSGFGGDSYRPSQTSGGTFANNRDPKALPYHLDAADMKNDLTGQRPIYPLSCYGPGRDAPRQLIEGPVEISPEELRVRFYAQRLAGNEAGAQQEESALNDKMQQQVQSILSDIDGAVRYIEEGANVHPNRIDVAKGAAPSSSAGNSTSTSNPFSQNSANSSSQASSNPFMKAPATSTFGQSSTPGFGRPAFGQASAPAQTSAFGQPSNPGQAASGFGAASSLGAKPSPFGQAAANTGGSAFGKPAFGASGFGQASMPGSGGAFGQKPAFGQASTPAAPSAFGQASAVGQQPSAFGKPAFGQSGFGQTSQPGASASPFGQAAQSGASPFGQAAQSNASPFGQKPAAQASPFGQQPATQASPFGQQQNTQASPFGQPSTNQASPFGQQPAAQTSPFGSNQSKPAASANPFQSSAPSQPSAFGQPSQPAASASPFGAQTQNTTSTQAANPFLQKAQGSAGAPAPTAGSPFGAAKPFAQASTEAQQQTQPSSQAQQQIQPNAASGQSKEIDPKDRFKEGKPEEYEGEQGRILEEIYRRVGQLGRFNDNEDIPLVPPKCEWIVPVPLL